MNVLVVITSGARFVFHLDLEKNESKTEKEKLGALSEILKAKTMYAITADDRAICISTDKIEYMEILHDPSL